MDEALAPPEAPQPAPEQAAEAAPEPEPYVAPGAYRVLQAAHYETTHAFYGPLDLSFDKGKQTPKNEQEEHALDHLVMHGVAERI